MRVLAESIRANNQAVQDRIDSDRLDWDEAVAQVAAEVRDLTQTRKPRLHTRRVTVQGVSVVEVVPRWDRKAKCWTTVAPVGSSVVRSGAVGMGGSGDRARTHPDPRFGAWQALREHPLFGSMVQPAKQAAGGWLDDAVFWELVEAETLAIKRAMLAEKFRR